jgi:hypothetical protein
MSFAKLSLPFIAAFVGCGPANQECSERDTRCDGGVAITCEVLLCYAGPCPTNLIEQTCADDEACTVDDRDGAGSPRAVCQLQ